MSHKLSSTINSPLGNTHNYQCHHGQTIMYVCMYVYNLGFHSNGPSGTMRKTKFDHLQGTWPKDHKFKNKNKIAIILEILKSVASELRALTIKSKKLFIFSFFGVGGGWAKFIWEGAPQGLKWLPRHTKAFKLDPHTIPSGTSRKTRNDQAHTYLLKAGRLEQSEIQNQGIGIIFEILEVVVSEWRALFREILKAVPFCLFLV